nr:hypothetical protein [Tanacetum cinerariifolium]
MKIIPNKEEVAIDAIPLVVKSLNIVDWKIRKEGKKSCYQIIRADGNSKMYLVFNRMLKEFDREDLEDLYNLVKVKYRSTRPVENLDLLLWGDLKTMFKPHVEDQGKIIGIKSHLNAAGITAAHIDVNTALRNHIILLVDQILTFYHGITMIDREKIMMVAGGNIMRKTPQVAYDLIENMTLPHFQWDIEVYYDTTTGNLQHEQGRGYPNTVEYTYSDESDEDEPSKADKSEIDPLIKELMDTFLMRDE